MLRVLGIGINTGVSGDLCVRALGCCGVLAIRALGCWKYWYRNTGMMEVLVSEHWDDGGIGSGALGCWGYW